MSPDVLIDGQPHKRPPTLVLRDIDQLLAPLPVALEVPPETFDEALGLIDSEGA